jgi:hypothetical protein
MYGPLPVEVAVFADGGLTWNGLQQASTVDGPIVTPTPPRAFRLRNGVTSAGVGLRVNLGGYAIGELDFVRPFQLPNRGWVFQFNLTPGF